MGNVRTVVCMVSIELVSLWPAHKFGQTSSLVSISYMFASISWARVSSRRVGKGWRLGRALVSRKHVPHLLDICSTYARPLLDLCSTFARPLLDFCSTFARPLFDQ